RPTSATTASHATTSRQTPAFTPPVVRKPERSNMTTATTISRPPTLADARARITNLNREITAMLNEKADANRRCDSLQERLDKLEAWRKEDERRKAEEAEAAAERAHNATLRRTGYDRLAGLNYSTEDIQRFARDHGIEIRSELGAMKA